MKLLTENKIQAADLFTTDPTIQENKLVVLEDPENVFSAQNVTPLINKSAVNEEAKAALNAVSAKLTTQDLLDMMKRVAIDKDDQEKVAEDWLKKAASSDAHARESPPHARAAGFRMPPLRR